MIAQILLSLLMYYFFYQFGNQREERDWSLILGSVVDPFLYNGFNFAILHFSVRDNKDIDKLDKGDDKNGTTFYFRNLHASPSFTAVEFVFFLTVL